MYYAKDRIHLDNPLHNDYKIWDTSSQHSILQNTVEIMLVAALSSKKSNNTLTAVVFLTQTCIDQ